MSLWSSVKKAAKRIWRAAKAVVRAIIRIVVVILTSPTKVWDLVFGWVAWPRKKLKLHIAESRSGPRTLARPSRCRAC